MHLYLSDLDGTLLQPDATVSDYTRSVLNRLADENIHFSVATARTAATVRHILAGVTISAPVILMNGACVYDLKTNRYVKAEDIGAQGRAVLFAALERRQMSGFVYTVDNNRLETFYEQLDNPAARAFVAERESRYGKVFQRVDRFAADLADKTVVYYSLSDRAEKLEPLARDLGASGSLRVEFYRDIYQPGHYFLEACALTASKLNAMRFLRQTCGYTAVTCFGDNLNDLPLFSGCEHCLAVANALPEVKERADGLIGSNTEDGVARWLSEHAGLKGAS